ncbi:hypothetical protein [Mycobacterium sp. TY815]|uniref:hypothetical protein n=1 Tax=Mycobacterium sp. TY815 TaxID=3050581 RepID=UPI002740706E|nr:hypothetical protein [Mycobacterium sp. TY815]MDP7702972.1 hypothetical protein [Mycobacterium sp. TY815]
MTPFDAAAVMAGTQREESLTDWGLDDFERPPYRLADYGLRPEQVDERFTLYNSRFRDRSKA